MKSRIYRLTMPPLVVGMTLLTACSERNQKGAGEHAGHNHGNTTESAEAGAGDHGEHGVEVKDAWAAKMCVNTTCQWRNAASASRSWQQR